MKKAITSILNAALHNALEAQREHMVIREALSKYQGQTIHEKIPLPVGYSLIVQKSGVKIFSPTGRVHPVCLATECDTFNISLFDLNDAENNVKAQMAADKIQSMLNNVTGLTNSVEELKQTKKMFVRSAKPFITGEFNEVGNPVFGTVIKLANVPEGLLNAVKRDR